MIGKALHLAGFSEKPDFPIAGWENLSIFFSSKLLH